MRDDLQAALTAVELGEAGLLSWGAVGAQWTSEELVLLLDKYGDGQQLLADLTALALVVPTPEGGYRSRSAETIRVLATLRQAFRREAILSGRRLVLDYRFLHRPRRRPCRNVSVDALHQMLGPLLGRQGERCFRSLVPDLASEFQARSFQIVLKALRARDDSHGVVVTAGTGSGKTLAFYLPLLAWICDQQPSSSGVVALALYPRNELLKDQLRTLVSYSLQLQSVMGDAETISLATWFGATPQNARWVTEGWAKSWRSVAGGFVCPYLACPGPDCEEGEMVWPMRELKAGIELLRCSDCGTVVPGNVLRLTRESARTKPPSIMLSTTESLNRQLSSPGNLRAFGVHPDGARAILLDEIHTYEGTTGAQNAYLFRRLREALGYTPLWAGLSATLTEPAEFFGRLVDLETDRVSVIAPDDDEMEESGAEYLVALRHDPRGNTGTLSTTIQAAMGLSRCLDSMIDNPFDPAIDSGGIFGSRLFAFTDKLDSTNRLYWDLLDAEGWAWPGSIKRGESPLTLAHLRSRDQVRLRPEQRERAIERDNEGQYWWLADTLGHGIEGDVQKHVGRTSSQDTGVSNDAEIVVATASLEVGFDDDRVGAVIQHKAPHDAAQFLQRKGRAGRNASTRPWTVVVLSDWGRDRDAWDAYDQLFSSTVPPRFLPLENLYVLRIQSVYAMLDWLARQLHYGTGSTWADTAGPADMLSSNQDWAAKTRARQAKLEDLLTSLLRDGPERAALVRHLRRSLHLGFGSASNIVIDKILWESPRPLLGVVVPTLRRRIRDQWKGERPAPDDSGLKTRTPLRDFVPGNLFDDLLVPDVEFEVPWARGEIRIQHLPALRAIREFLPGNVSRHFGVKASNKRHWIPLPTETDRDGTHLVDVSQFGGMSIDAVHTGSGTVRVFAPTHVVLEQVPEEVSDASSMKPLWGFVGVPIGSGTSLSLGEPFDNLFADVAAHLHSQGGGVRIVRFALGAQGAIWRSGSATPVKLKVGTCEEGTWEPAALGVEIYCDALVGRVYMPDLFPTPSREERTDWVRELAQEDRNLPDYLTPFDRQALADCLEALAVKWAWSSGEPNPTDISLQLQTIAYLLGLGNPAKPGSFDRCLADLEVANLVCLRLREAKSGLRSPRWLAWSQRRFTLTAAVTLVQALASGSSHVDPEDLLIDLDPSDATVFIVSEQSPGGLGQVEALALSAIERPETLPSAFAEVLRPTELELMDEQLSALVNCTDPTVVEAVEQLASSWPLGHEAVQTAAVTLDRALDAAGLVMGHPARNALATRLAGPGSTPAFLSEVKAWLGLRESVEQSTGFAVDGRSLALLLSDRYVADTHLHLQSADEVTRTRAIGNVLWPWGAAVHSGRPFNPYGVDMPSGIDLLRNCWTSPVTEVVLDEWGDDERETVHQLLRQAGQLLLRIPSTGKKTLKVVLLDLQVTPVEVGPIWCYPVILGIQDHGAETHARILLRETW